MILNLETEIYEFIARLRDACDQISAEADKLLKSVGKRVTKEYDAEKVAWTKAEGSKGSYERAETQENPDYKALLADLKDHNGRMQIKGNFYWLFQDDKTIGRKPSTGLKKAKVPPTTTQPLGISKIQELFPKDLEDMLLFEEKEEYIVVRPRQYLGSDNFVKIAKIVRDAKGKYVSAGSESHFKVPKS